MGNPERRFFNRYRRAMPFVVQVGERAVRVGTVNTSSGGAFFQTSLPVAVGQRVEMVLPDTQPGQPSRLALIVDVVHVHSPEGTDVQGFGARWLEVRSSVSPAIVSEFLERVLGIAKVRVRKIVTAEERPLYIFEFPRSLAAQSVADATDLADMLEPASEQETAAVQEESALRSLPGRQGWLRKLSSLFGKSEDNRVLPVPPVARPTKAESPGAVESRPPTNPGFFVPQAVASKSAPSPVADPAVPVEPRTGSVRRSPGSRRVAQELPPVVLTVIYHDKRIKGQLFRLGKSTADVSSVSGIPPVYQRVTLSMSLRSGKKDVEVQLTGYVTRVRDETTFTVRYTQVDDGNSGVFEAFLTSVLPE